MAFASQTESPLFVRTLAKGYTVLLLVLLSIVPAAAIAYVYFFQDPSLRFEQHGFHEIAIGVSLLQSAFIAYVTWQRRR